MRRLLLAGALLVPLAVVAASATFTLSATEAIDGQVYVGASNCGTKTINFNWDVSVGHPTAGETVVGFYAPSSADCNNATLSSSDKQVSVSQNEIGSLTVPATDLILDQSDAGLPGGCSNTTRSSASPYTTVFCLQVKGTSISGTTISSLNVPVNFATAPPTAPAAVSAQGGDSHLRVDWQAGNASEKIAYYDVHVLAAGDALDPNRYADRVNAQTNSNVDHTDSGAPLKNNTPYTVQIIATDLYGNLSAASGPITGTPVAVLDFYGLYRQQGGSAAGGGGCSSAGTGSWLALLALAAVLGARRKRGAAVAAALALAGPAARAAPRTERPARKLLLGLKVDRYDPKVDSERGLTGAPYHTIFGPRAPLRYQLEADWEVAHPFGSLLVGGTVGFWQNFGKGVVADASGAPAVPAQRSTDTALLDVVPFGAIATYRFDWLADRYPRFPLIPYAQAGLMRALWVSLSGSGSVSRGGPAGGRGSGWTNGYTTALGVAVDLNAIDPEVAREAYVDTGIQRTSLFAEYGWTHLDGFHKSGALILSDRAWRFGLALEF